MSIYHGDRHTSLNLFYHTQQLSMDDYAEETEFHCGLRVGKSETE